MKHSLIVIAALFAAATVLPAQAASYDSASNAKSPQSEQHAKKATKKAPKKTKKGGTA